MKKAILGLLFAVGSVCATDVSQMKILGIGLGDKYENIKKKLPCNKRADYESFFEVSCSDGKSNFTVAFDGKKEVYNISRRLEFSVEPDWDKIQNDLIEKYGEPTLHAQDSDMHYYVDGFCWGSCKRGSGQNPAMGDRIQSSLEVNILHGKNGNENQLNFYLLDAERLKNNQKYGESLQNKKKQQASKIQF